MYFSVLQIICLDNVHLTPTLPPPHTLPTSPTPPSPIQRAREELHDLESSMDNTGALLRGATEMPHKSEPPELEDVEEETEVRGTCTKG